MINVYIYCWSNMIDNDQIEIIDFHFDQLQVNDIDNICISNETKGPISFHFITEMLASEISTSMIKSNLIPLLPSHSSISFPHSTPVRVPICPFMPLFFQHIIRHFISTTFFSLWNSYRRTIFHYIQTFVCLSNSRYSNSDACYTRDAEILNTYNLAR